MVKVALQIRATLENVDELRTSQNFSFFFKVKCTNCGEESEKWHDLNATEKFHEDDRSKGFSLYMKCKLCSRENSIDIMPGSNVSYFASDSGAYKSILTLDCRGIEPTSFDPRSGWIVRSENKGLVFKGVDLSADPTYWCEYDTKNRVSVTISEFESQFIKVKK